MSGLHLDIADLDSVPLADLTGADARSRVVLTINNRLSRRLMASLVENIREPGQVIEIPAVMPWSNWLPHLLRQASFESDLSSQATILDNFSSQALWVKTIEQAEDTDPLLDVNLAAKSAQQADTLLSDWEIEVGDEESTEEFERFGRWQDAYRQNLHAIDALDSNTLASRVLSLIEAGSLALPQTLVLAGFSELSPRMLRILGALREQGTAVQRLEERSRFSQIPRCVALETYQDEWMAAACWAKEKLLSSPQGKFAIIAVSLDADVAHARRALDKVLKPDGDSLPYNVAVGRPLSDWDLGRAMLLWLNTFVQFSLAQEIAPKDLGAALLAGHCAGHVTEAGARANVDARWRNDEVISVSLTAWQKKIESTEQLAASWNMAFQPWQTDISVLTCSAWAQRFSSTLRILGFPGERSQSSVHYQVTEALEKLVDRFAQLSSVLGLIDAREALSWFGRLARATIFQPQRDVASRLDVLGLLEAEGGQWDGVWLLGLSDEAFPAAPNPNPFIPVSALSRSSAPRSTAERELLWAQRMFEHLCTVAPDVMTSFARRDGERELRPSPVLKSATEVENTSKLATAVIGSIELEMFEDSQGPVVAEGEVIKGGASLLATQARNPLWAFFLYRLGVKGLKPYADAPAKTIRGSFIHKILERLWSELKDQKALQNCLANDSLHQLLRDIAIDAAAAELAQLPEVLRIMEIERDLPLIRQWLELECLRAPFVVSGVEVTQQLNLGMNKLEVVIDRIDELEDGTHVVIDYKSSRALTSVLKDWDGERPAEVQLPIYAGILLEQAKDANSLTALMLVQIHAKQNHTANNEKTKSVAGLASVDIGVAGVLILPDEKEFSGRDWLGAMTKMQHDIQVLTKEFVTGCARNESLRKDDLIYCDIKPLLRYFDRDEDADD